METDLPADCAIVFPGISAFNVLDAAKFMLVSAAARELVAEADEVLGYPLVDRAAEAADGEFTEATRVTFMLTCLALARMRAEEHGPGAQMCVGPSFGGPAAAVHAGALPFADAVRMTARWAHHLAEYFAGTDADLVTVSCARTPPDLLAAVTAELDERGEWHDVACFVDDDVCMLSVREEMLGPVRDRLRAGGGMPLDTMRPPLHSERFRPLRDVLERELTDGFAFADPEAPIVCDHDGRVLSTAAEVRTMLLDAVVRPVRWPLVVGTLRDAGVRTLCVAGDDGLWGRVGATTSSFDVVNVTPATVLRPRRRRRVSA